MRAALIFAAVALVTGPVAAETLVAARTVRAHTILGAGDLALIAEAIPGALSRHEEAVGLEARTILYAGRPILPEQVGPAASVERNALVTLLYQSGGLSITAEGRALGRGGPGDAIRVMNLGSRTTVTGTIDAAGRVIVGPAAAN